MRVNHRPSVALPRTLSLSQTNSVAAAVLKRLDGFAGGSLMGALGSTAGGGTPAFVGLPVRGLAREVDALRAAVSAGHIGQPSLGRSAFARALPQLFQGAAELGALGRPLQGAMNGAYERWSALFSPMMRLATAARFADQLQRATLGQNPLVNELARALTEEVDRTVGKLSAVSGLDMSKLRSMMTPSSLGQALSEQFSGDPLSFPPIGNLSRRTQDALAAILASGNGQVAAGHSAMTGAGQQLEQQARSVLNELQAFPGQLEAQARNLEQQLAGLPGRLERQGQEVLQTIAGLPRALEDQARGVVSELQSGVDRLGRAVEGVASDPLGAVRNALPTNVTLAEGSAEARAAAFRRSGSVGRPDGPFYAQGSITLLEAQASASGRVSADLKNFRLAAEGKVEASVDLVKVEGSFRAGNSQYLNAMGNGQARVGANAAGQGSLAFDPAKGNVALEAGGKAFAGAHASAAIAGTLGPISAGASVGAQVGIGAHFNVKAGLKDGKFSFGLDVGAALGIGLRLKLDLSINFKPLLNVVGSVVNGIGKGVAAAGKAIKEGVKKAVKWAGDAAKEVGKGVEKAAKAVGNAVKGATRAVKKFFKGW